MSPERLAGPTGGASSQYIKRGRRPLLVRRRLHGRAGLEVGRARGHGTIRSDGGWVVTQAMMAWSAAWALIAALASARLLRVPGQPERSVKNGYRWFAVAAICLAAGATVQQAFGGLGGGASPLRLADPISRAAGPALVVGLATLTSKFAAGEPGGHGAPGRGPRGASTAGGAAGGRRVSVGAPLLGL